MKNWLILSLFISTLLVSCGRKTQEAAIKKAKSGFVLGAYYDIEKPSTLKLKELASLPKVVDLKNIMTEVKNQGTRGSCTYFSTIALVESVIKKEQNIDVNLSEEYLSYLSKSLGNSPYEEGGDVEENLISLIAFGFLYESDSPYEPSWFSKGLACEETTPPYLPINCYSHEKPSDDVLKRIIHAHGLESVRVPNNTNEVIKYLATKKLPVTVGLMVNDNIWTKTPDVYFNKDTQAECNANEDLCGGHSIILTGYDLNKKIFFFKNSWGSDWGREGYGTITFDSVDRFSNTKFFSVKLNQKLDLTPVISQKTAILNQAQIRKVETSEEVQINISADLSNTLGKTYYSSAVVVKKNDGNEASDKNTTPTEKVIKDGAYTKATEDELHLNTKLILKKDSLPKGENYFLKTTLYLFTDKGLLSLKREYLPL